MRRWPSHVLELRAKIADLQLCERPERAGRAAAKGEYGSVRTDFGGIERTGLCRTIIDFDGIGIGISNSIGVQ